MRVLAAGLIAMCCGAASAQSLSYAPFTIDPSIAGVPGATVLNGPVDVDRAYVNVSQINGFTLGAPGSNGGNGYVSVPSLLAVSSGISQAQMSTALIGIANRIDRLQSRFSEGIALAGSINVLPPNEGDRFAVSFGGAGYDGAGAGSVAVSARVGDAIVYGALARGPTQSLVKGGVGWSFR